MDAIHGLTLEKMAEAGAKYGELKAKFGDKEAEAEFARYLAGEGVGVRTYWDARKAWNERFKADPTGMLHARFLEMEGQLSIKAHFGDVRDMSQDTQEGMTLDKYAQISVAMQKPGANAEAILREHGVPSAAHWQKVNAAWSDAMANDPEHKLAMQYGTLYQKHAGPAFQEAAL